MTTFDTFFQTAPLTVNVSTVHQAWRALMPAYRPDKWELPLPAWRYRPYDESGEQAWHTLQHKIAQIGDDKPFCIYLHIPFCSSKCGFCDNYSFKLGSQQQKHIQAYVDRLCDELRLWGAIGNLKSRPVSTVHMGGGTPTFLGVDGLRQIMDCCRECFTITDQTEWALESTVNDLTPDMIQTMHEAGYRRLHLGVQSLQDDVRQAIGRRNPAEKVIGKIEETMALGWIVSVDMICGLPNQTLTGFMDNIQTLIDMGIHGVSVYELLIYPQNKRWAIAHQLDNPSRHEPNFWMFMAGATLLEQWGYRKNLFNHWADEADKNIYFTFPTRGEDLLAVGTIADGVFGDYQYRHPRYADYMAHGLPALEGGLRHNAYEKRLSPYITQVLSARLSSQFASALPHLIERWHKHALIRPMGDGGYELTASGAWFAGNMIAELHR